MLLTVREHIARGTRRLQRAPLHFGHGTDNALDDAAALVWHAMRLPQPVRAEHYARRVTARAAAVIDILLQRRIDERLPAVYLTGKTWFAGMPFKIDARALVPRSPLAELIEQRFAPWIDAARVHNVLDVGTGSGCIALAVARYLPHARVDAVDISAAALALARANCRRHRLTSRVRLIESDYFAAIRRCRYDIIVSNPPYVGAREMRSLPAEYWHEPRMALAAGRDGLDAVHVLLNDAARHLRVGGVLIVEVGNTERAVRRAYPRMPFTWLEFERGGGGVFLLTKEQLDATEDVR